MKPFILSIFALLSLGLTSSQALNPINGGVLGRVAIKGYDPVAYFTTEAATPGNKKISTEWMDIKWRFANEDHLALFKKNPEKYAPQYGGYCAYAISQNNTANVDPKQWTIVDGKLYLNYNKDISVLWKKDMEQYIKDANTNWPKLLQKK